MFTITYHFNSPVLKKGMAGTENNKYGFEGGTAIKHNGQYHLFTSELVDDPKAVKMRLAHWISDDRTHFERVSTLYESRGDFTGQDPRAALWSPMPRYNEDEGRWNLFYVAYRALPNTEREWRLNFEGKIWRAVSQIPGRDGIGGPYVDDGIVLQPGPDSDPWEGLQGTDSFFPYLVENEWYAFYGSAQTENYFNNGDVSDEAYWGVGLASATRLAGPWTRCSERNPIIISDKFTENPVVSRLEDGTYVAMYDGGGVFGYSVSADGLTWSKGQLVHFRPENESWVKYMRTPLCLIPEGNNTYTVYYTAFDSDGYGCIGLVELKR